MTAGAQPVARRHRSSAVRAGGLTEIWKFRELLRSLMVRNLKVKYQRSVLGFLWTLLNPLLTVVVLVVVFSYVVRIQVPDYWAFLLAGYFVWNFVQQMLSSSASVLLEHAALRRSIAFPDEVPILGAAAARLVEFGVEMALALAVLIVFRHHGVPASFVLLPVLVVLQLLIAVGLMMIVSTLSVFYFDVQHALPILLLILFYLSPVFYPASLVPEQLRGVYYLNPLAGLLTLFHTTLYMGHFPSALFLGGVTVEALIIALLGYVVFSRYQPLFAEIL